MLNKLIEKLKSLFGNKTPAMLDSSTPHVQNRAAEMSRQNTVSELRYAAGQSIGRVRKQNEDSLFANSIVIAGNNKQTRVGIFIIADGMGGHHHGEVASGLAINTIISELQDSILLPLYNQKEKLFENNSLHEILQHAVSSAQNAVVNAVPGAGTTVTMVVVVNSQASIVNIGDSRCYLLPDDGSIQSLTIDHSLVNRLVELGQITAEEAVQHPQKNILYKAIGQKGEIDADIETHSLHSGDRLLLCSDGLWGQISDDLLQNAITSAASLDQAVEDLISLANGSGGPDNISAILIQVP